MNGLQLLLLLAAGPATYLGMRWAGERRLGSVTCAALAVSIVAIAFGAHL